LFSNKPLETVNKHAKNCVTNYQTSSLWKWNTEATKICKPEVTNPEHTTVEIFKGEVKNKNINSKTGVVFSNKLF
jgi:hypothetical protein